MFAFRGDGVNDLYQEAIRTILSEGMEVRPRGTVTLELHPALLEIRNPLERLVTSYGRPVNVAFALAEVLWILGGRRDVEMLAAYNGTISNYSDDGEVFNAAYGYRLRHAFGHDQLDDVVRTLQDDHYSRQAVLQMWHPAHDRGWDFLASHNGGVGDENPVKRQTKDRACNTQALLLVRDGALDWTQIIRSNDALWGTPYNWMQWTHLQEYVAARLGVQVGSFYHLANSLHIYDHQWNEAGQIDGFNAYREFDHQHEPMGLLTGEGLTVLLREEHAMRISQDPVGHVLYGVDEMTPYWRSVMMVLLAHHLYRAGKNLMAFDLLAQGDPVYAAAQARFYYHWRWHKPEFESILTLMEGWLRERPEVFKWITASHA